MFVIKSLVVLLFVHFCANIEAIRLKRKSFSRTGVSKTAEIPMWNGAYSLLLSDNEKAALEATVKSFMRRWNIPGLALAIAKDGQLGYANGFGNAIKDGVSEKVSTRTTSRLASVSKPFTSVAIHRLVDDGVVRLEDFVFPDLLPLPSGVPLSGFLSRVTLRNLLQHTSGGWSNPDPLFEQYQMNDNDFLRFVLNKYPLSAEPGTRYAYSNFGYYLLGLIIERHTGAEYEQHLKNAIFPKLNMCDMYVAGTTLQERREYEFVYYDDKDAGAPYNGSMQRIKAAGGWATAPLDLIKLVFKLNVDLDGVGGLPPLLRASTIISMVTPSAARPTSASGWMVNSEGDWWHYGSLPGTATVLHRHNKPRIALAIVMNGNPNNESFPPEFMDLKDNLLETIKFWPMTDPLIFRDCYRLFQENSPLLTTTLTSQPSGNICKHHLCLLLLVHHMKYSSYHKFTSYRKLVLLFIHKYLYLYIAYYEKFIVLVHHFNNIILFSS